ncbi:hypothetical protein Tco_0373592 [Tanacetum coccineum]
MMESLPKMIDKRIKKILQTQVPLHVAQGFILEREKSRAEVAKMVTDAIQQERENVLSEISSQVNDAITNHIPSQVDSSVMSYMSGHVLHVQQDDLPIWLALKYKFERLHMATTPCRPYAVRPRDLDNPHDDAHSEGENSSKRQKTSEHGTFVFGESSSGQDYECEPGLSMSGNQDQSDDFDFWTNSYASDDDVLPNEKVSQELIDEMSQTVDEAKLRKVVDEMLRQQCTSGDEYQYHIDQMQNFFCQRDPKAPALSLVNQDLLYLKKGNMRPEKIALSLHKFPAVRFPDNDIKERTSRWVTKCVKKFNPYARYGVEHWKNSHAKIFYISKQQELGKPKEEVYSNSKIVDDYAETGLLWLILEGLKSYNNDVKYGYVTHNLSKKDVEYLQLFAEEIEEQLKYRDQMRRWEMYVNRRPLGSRRERPE